MNSEYKNISNSSGYIIKIFLLILSLFIYQNNRILGFGLAIFVLLIFCCDLEIEDEYTKDIIKIKNRELKYDHTLETLKIEGLLDNFYNLAVSNSKFRDNIEQKILEVYSDMKTNEQLKQYLQFNNLVDGEGKLVFKNETFENILKNKIKIILNIMDKDDLNRLYDEYTKTNKIV